MLPSYWNPVTGGDMLYTGPASGRNPYSIWRLQYPSGPVAEVAPHGCCGAQSPAYAPDGARFAFLRWASTETATIHIARADGSGERQPACRSDCRSVSWSPDGGELVASRQEEQGLWRIRVPPPGGACSEPVRLTSGPYNDDSPSWRVVRVR